MHSSLYWLLFAAITVVVAYVLKLWLKEDGSVKLDIAGIVHCGVVVGVLSSREHFLQRNILRKGLSKQATTGSALLKFIVSATPCKVPEEDRVDVYGCVPDPFLKPAADYFYSHQLVYVPDKDKLKAFEGPFGVDFVVEHPVLIKGLGLFDNNVDGFSGPLKVVLFDRTTEKPIVASVFTSFSSGTLVGFHRFKSTKEMVLPKGFRGSIVVEGSTADDPMLQDVSCILHDGEGLLTVEKGYRIGITNGEFPDINKHVQTACYYSGPSLKYSSYDVGVTANGTELAQQRRFRYERLLQQLLMEEAQLQDEIRLYDDIVLVETVESYRNLPAKMLKFYEWLSSHVDFEYVLKTDDDCYVNMTGITQLLLEIKRNKYKDAWLGNFRRNFPLNRFGKWAEHDYVSRTYPPFACGSGYVLSSNIVHWISLNMEYLKMYQGEDTSLGIWLAAILPTIITENRFKCFHGCEKGMLSSPENTLAELEFLYSNNSSSEDTCERFNDKYGR